MSDILSGLLGKGLTDLLRALETTIPFAGKPNTDQFLRVRSVQLSTQYRAALVQAPW
jgi:hypothetical protein